MFSSTKTGEDGRISAVVHILSSATKWAAIYSEQILVQKYRRKLIYSHVFCGGLLCCVRLFCCVLISCLSVKSIQLSWGHRWRWRNKRQDKCVVRMTDTVTIAKQCTQKGRFADHTGKEQKRRSSLRNMLFNRYLYPRILKIRGDNAMILFHPQKNLYKTVPAWLYF